MSQINAKSPAELLADRLMKLEPMKNVFLGTMSAYWTMHAENVLAEECESEIEKLFFTAWRLVRMQDEILGCPCGGNGANDIKPPGPIMELPDKPHASKGIWRVDLIQIQPCVSHYRIDFAIARAERIYGELIWAPMILIELDGHEFHERTKEQASRDKARDRELQTIGYPVLRFTGSEVWNNPAKCVANVDDFFSERFVEICKAKRAERKVQTANTEA